MPYRSTPAYASPTRPPRSFEAAWRHVAVAVVAAVSVGLAATDAGAAVSMPPAAGHNITVFPDRDFVHVDGYAPGQSLTIDVVRNGTVIGTATGAADAAGIVEVNHPGGICWTAVTPDILPGDVVQALTDPAGPTGDATTTADVAVTDGPATDAAGHVIVRGIARGAAGAQLPLGQLEQRMVNPAFVGTQHKRDARAPGDGTLSYDAPGSIHWTATYAFSGADAATALDPGTMTRVLWRGGNPALLNELTISEFATPGGPAPGCNAPLAQTAMTTISRSLVNAASLGEDITVGGPAQGGAAGVTAVDVSVPESAGSSAPIAATLSPPGSNGQATWQATIPAAILADSVLPQGDFHVVATYTGPGAPPADTRVLRKDTIAPPAPVAVPSPGTYPVAQAVALTSAEAAAAVHYTLDGSNPLAASPPFAAAVPVTSAATIKAVAVDAAGNASAPATFEYKIAPPAALVIHDRPATIVIHDRAPSHRRHAHHRPRRHHHRRRHRHRRAGRRSSPR